MSTLDDLLAGGGKSFKFDRIGDTVTGTIASVIVRQVTNFDTGKPEFWDDGKPQEQIVVTLSTNLKEDEDDDGARNVYIKGWGGQLRAFREAVRAAGSKPAPGDTFTATYVADGEQPKKGFPPKVYTYQLVKATGLDALVGGQPAAPATPPVSSPAPQPVSAPTPQAAPADLAKQLIRLGLDTTSIATTTGLDAAVVEALRQVA